MNTHSNASMALGLVMGTLNTCVLTLALVLSLYLSADLGEILDGLSTAIGLAVFALLWTVTCICTYKGWQEMNGDTHLSWAGASAKWGVVNGVSFFLALLAVVLIVAFAGAVVEGNGDGAAGVIAFSFIAGGIGTILSSLVGLVFGMAFGAVDMLFLATARALVGAQPALLPIDSP